MLDILKKKCPKCGGSNINRLKENFFKRARRFFFIMMFFVLILFLKGSKPLNVCRDCGFSWEDR